MKISNKASTSDGIMPKRAKVKNMSPKENDKGDLTSSVIRLSHIPYGFFERELRGYFAQFGKVRRVRVLRNKKVSYLKLVLIKGSSVQAKTSFIISLF